MRPVYIIAEAGVNHNGDPEIARQLIKAAAKAGADAVKFQTFKADKIVTRSAGKAEYQIHETGLKESHYEMIKRLELDADTHAKLMETCQRNSIDFLSSPFDLDSADLLASLGLEIFKIPSGEITNLPLLRRIGTLDLQVILSTGMSTLKEVEQALDVLAEAGTAKDQVTVLHCNTEYPTPFEDVNLAAMTNMSKQLGVAIGYSDHTRGIEIPVAAVSRGAIVIEKHFTLSRSMDGPDHAASLEPDELSAMVSAIRNVEKALGDGIKRPSPSEQKNMTIARKSIVASVAIRRGDTFSTENLSVKRPGNGISPMLWDSVIGQEAKRDFAPDEIIEI